MRSIFNQSLSRVLLIASIALVITAGSLWYSSLLVNQLAKVEEDRIRLYAESLEFIGNSIGEEENSETQFVFNNITRTNELIPTILADSAGNISACMNLGLEPGLSKADSVAQVKEYYETLRDRGYPAPIVIDNYGFKIYIWYDESSLLKKLRWFPYLQLLVISVFILIVFISFLSAKRSEQNKVWVGLAKETAHQLGTPVSSLMAWVELLKLQKTNAEDEELIAELEKDVDRLKTISERFSKIGSQPELHKVKVTEMLERSAGYIRKRMSKKVQLVVANEVAADREIAVNPPLFDWVVENLLKNALDAIPDAGTITIRVSESAGQYFIDIEDTGKGIPKSLFRQVFKPGFTTKKRGWGLGLSLTRRIVENYHNGKIFVKWSEINKGTIFRVVLPAD